MSHGQCSREFRHPHQQQNHSADMDPYFSKTSKLMVAIYRGYITRVPASLYLTSCGTKLFPQRFLILTGCIFFIKCSRIAIPRNARAVGWISWWVKVIIYRLWSQRLIRTAWKFCLLHSFMGLCPLSSSTACVSISIFTIPFVSVVSRHALVIISPCYMFFFCSTLAIHDFSENSQNRKI